jgi:hypothetical protein
MDDNPLSLSNLRGIVIPDAPSFWPLAPGAWVALGMIGFVLLFVAWRIHTVRRRNAYRKAGLSLLRGAATVHDVSVILKRVALAVFPREQVASLYGDDWAAFMHKTCPRQDFEELVRNDASADPDERLVALASTWIRHHRVPETNHATVVN